MRREFLDFSQIAVELRTGRGGVTEEVLEAAAARLDADERQVKVNHGIADLVVSLVVADLHQPLHAAYESDRGGGKVGVCVPGDDSANLHWVWDSWLVEARLGATGTDWRGYAEALQYFDGRLPELLDLMKEDDVLVLCADHGCDPTWPGSDHTRENIPVLVYGAGVTAGSLGKRNSFADIGQSLAGFFDLSPMDYGESFLTE